MKRIIQSSFFERRSYVVARDLLGKFLVRKISGKVISTMVTEVEAYGGASDMASHARFGKNKRNAAMWGKPGTFYVYLIYGMHWMLNIVCEPMGCPSAVLVRGLDTINGPGRVGKHLKIDKSLNGRVAGIKVGMWFEDCGYKVMSKNIKLSKRIGVGYAGNWSRKLWNFSLIQNKP